MTTATVVTAEQAARQQIDAALADAGWVVQDAKAANLSAAQGKAVQLEAAVETNLKRTERLRRAILRRAFAGKLVAQDPSDKPASVLWERIRAEREHERSRLNGKVRVGRNGAAAAGGSVVSQAALPGV